MNEYQRKGAPQVRSAGGACAKITPVEGGVLVGSTLHQDELFWNTQEWSQFLTDVKADRFDDVTALPPV
jgi:hypothetical protein